MIFVKLASTLPLRYKGVNCNRVKQHAIFRVMGLQQRLLRTLHFPLVVGTIAYSRIDGAETANALYVIEEYS
jgi:hypothetical protein